MQIRYHLLCVLGGILLLGSCGLKKEASVPQQVVATQQIRSELYTRLEEQSTSWTAVKARLDGELQAKDKEFNARIQLQAARGKGIRLSVQYLLFEVARVWFTPDEVVFVDLINGGYAQEPYSSFSQRLGLNIDYDQIEALIMGAVFAPGKGTKLRSLESLRYQALAAGRHQLSGTVLGYSYDFALSPEAILQQLNVTDSKGRRVFDALYMSAATLGLPTMTAPAESTYTIYTSSSEQTDERSKGSLRLSWQDVQLLGDDSSLSLKPIIKDKYTRIDLGVILKLLNK